MTGADRVFYQNFRESGVFINIFLGGDQQFL